MKRHNHLFTQICSIENLFLAHQNARRGKSHYKEVAVVDADPAKYIQELQRLLMNQTLVTSQYEVFLKKGKKDRYIYKLPYFPDRILHHAIMQILEPIWESVLIADTYSSIKHRGIHRGVRRMKSFLKDTYGAQYCLKIDVKKFYPSVDHDILFALITKKIKCFRTLDLLQEIIYSTDGLPIGNYLSQYFGNIYLTYFDHYVKETLGVKYYSRYCDDIVMLKHNKNLLHELRGAVTEYLRTDLHLNLNSNIRIFPSNKGIDYLGYIFYPNRIRVRKSIVAAFKSRIALIKKQYGYMTYSQIVNSLMSYYGWFKHGNAIALWQKYIDPEVQRILRFISKKSKRKLPILLKG